MATWDDATTCWLPKPGVAARYTLEFDGAGRFLMRPLDAGGQSAPGAFAGGSVVALCQMLAASLPGCAIVSDPSESPMSVGGYVNRWADLAALLTGKAAARRAVAWEAYGVRPWVRKYITRSLGGVMAPTALGLAADAKLDADLAAIMAGAVGAKS